MTLQQKAALPPEQRRQVAIREKFHGLAEVDVVKAWYESEDPFDLLPGEDNIRKRWDFAKAQFLNLKTYTQTIEALQTEFKISISQARIDVRNMRHTFGPIDEVPKIARRQLAMQMALEAFGVAKDAKDADGMAKATKAYISAAGLDKDDAEPFDLEKLMRDRTYVEVLDPSLRSLFLNLLAQSGGVLDLSALFGKIHEAGQSADFVDYELVPTEASDETP